MTLEETTAPLSHLLLDPNNFRYQDVGGFVLASSSRFHEETVQNAAYDRLASAGLSELKNSILTNGFLPFERIVVKPYEGADDRYLVVEGNRRVAALRWIQADHQAGVNVRDDVMQVLDSVPVIVVAGEDEAADPALILSLMGVRHVGGIREWGGYQRAKLVTELRDTYGLDTSEVASRLGLTAHEVNRRYRAFRALRQMMNDEEYGDQAAPGLYPHFHEAVGGQTIKQWLEWDEESAEFTNPDNLLAFYGLITPSEDDEGVPMSPKLPTREAVRELRDILPLPEARRALLDPQQSFHDALALAKADALANTWVAQVGEAIAAMRSVGALELEQLSDDDRAEIQKLRDTADELLALYTRLQP